MNIKALLKNVVNYKASDLHLVSRSEPQIRIDGTLVPLDMDRLDGVAIEEMCYTLLSDKQKKAVRKILILRRNIVNFRKIIQNHKNVLQKLLEMESSLVEKKAIKKYYASLVDNSKRIWETLDNQKEMVEVLNNTNESILNDVKILEQT